MGTYAALAHGAYVDGYDLTGDATALTLTLERDALDVTVFGPTVTSRSRKAGLEDVQASASVLWQSGPGLVDTTLFPNLGGRRVLTMFPTPTETGRAYFFQATDFTYSTDYKVGEMVAASWAAQGGRGSGLPAVGAIPGYLAKVKADVSATGVLGTFKQLGAVGATQFLYGVLHLIGTAGTSITVVLESDDSSGFASATTQITFGPLTTTGATWGTRVAGPLTDDFYRYRVTAITGTWSVAAAFGIK